MSAFEVVTIVVSVVAIGLAATTWFRLQRVLEQMGRRGLSFERTDDREIAERPSDDERDDPIPGPPLRGRRAE